MLTKADIERICREDSSPTEGIFNAQLWNHLANSGLFQSPFENATTLMALMTALGKHCNDGGFSFALGAHLFGSQRTLELFGCEATILDEVRNGAFVAHAITEEEVGSDVFSMNSRATLEGDQYRLVGSKAYISGIALAQYALIYAITDPGKGTMGGISAFLLTPGEFEITTTHEKMGLTSCPMANISFNTLLPASRLVGKPGGGFGMFSAAMNWERVGLSAIHLGTMQRVLETTIAYANARVVGNEPISKKQAIQFKLADMATAVEVSKLMVMKGTNSLDKGREAAAQAARTKLFVSEAYVSVCREAMQIFGAKGYLKSYGIERTMRDALASTISSGTSEIQRNIIAGWLI